MNTPSPYSSQFGARRAGFTLIELLTVIAIIGILAAILVPVVGKVRSTARNSQGVANVRQIGLAAISYATDNRNMLPTYNSYGGDNVLYGQRISAYVARSSATPTTPVSDIFIDPSAENPPVQNPLVTGHFAPLDVFAKASSNDPAGTDTIPANSAAAQFRDFTRTKAPAKQIYAGAISWNSSASMSSLHGTIYNCNAGWWVVGYQNRPANEALPAVTEGNQGSGEFRVKDGFTKVVFLDGHAANIRYADIRYRMLDPRYE